MSRRMRILVAAAVLAGLVPTAAFAQYGTSSSSTTAPTTTTTRRPAVTTTVPSGAPSTVPGATTTTVTVSAADIDLDALLSGDIARFLASLTDDEQDLAALNIARIIEEILAAGGGELGEITVVGGATLERGEGPNAPITLSFSAPGYAAHAVVTFILESTPVLLGTADANDQGEPTA